MLAFLETNAPKSKGAKIKLGVSDPKLCSVISESLAYIQCIHYGVVPEIVRGIRIHFPSLIKGLTPLGQSTAQLGLGHSYSRSKVKFNVHRVDNMIIQAISLLDQLDKDINTFTMRIREWYSYHFPELFKVVSDQYSYCRCAKFIRDRKTLSEEQLPELAEILMDEAKAQEILEVSRSSMGMDINPIDLINIERFADRVLALLEYRKELQEYLKDRMHSCAPSLASLIGEQVGARLISKAGSLTNLAKYPASTIQILGAEKALFRALKTKGNTPKYGLLFNSTYISRASAKNKGRISRFLANKCALASRIDCFSETPVTTFGDHLKIQVEERLKFFETGEKQKKNADVMHEATVEASGVQAKLVKKRKKLEKKEKKAKEVEVKTEFVDNNIVPEDTETSPVKEKKKKRKIAEVEAAAEPEPEQALTRSAVKEKKKKKKRDVDEDDE